MGFNSAFKGLILDNYLLVPAAAITTRQLLFTQSTQNMFNPLTVYILTVLSPHVLILRAFSIHNSPQQQKILI